MNYKKLSNLPFAIVILLSIIVLALFSFNGYLGRMMNENEININEIATLGGEIRTLDLETTNLALSYAGTKDPEVINSYDLKVTQMGKKIEELKKHVLSVLVFKEIEALNSLSFDLIKIQRSSIDIVGKENQLSALKLLNGTEYKMGGTRFSEKLESLINQMQAGYQEKIAYYQRLEAVNSILRLIIALTLVAATLLLFVTVRTSNKKKEQLIEEIEKNNQELEEKVAERTETVEKRSAELENQMKEIARISDELRAENEEREMLQEATEQNIADAENRARFEESLALLSFSLRGDLSVKEACTRALEIFQHHLEMQMGAIYIVDEEARLKREASFAYPSETKESFKMGEGCVGEAAFKRERVAVTDIPESCVLLFGGGSIKPVLLEAYPLIYGKNLVGVFEIDSMKTLSDYGRLWIEKAGEILALSVFIIKEADKLRRAFEVVEESQEDLNRILDSTVNGIYGVDLNGEITFVNKSALDMLGYGSGVELLGKHDHELLHHTRADGTLFPKNECPMLKSITEGSTLQSEELFWKKDGTSLWVDVTSNPIIRDEKIEGAVFAFQDITERKNAEILIKKERERIEQILYSSPVGVGIEVNGIARMLNPALSEIMGIVPGQMMPDIYVDKTIKDSVIKSVTEKGVLRNVDLQIFGSDGGIRDILATYMKVDYDGETGVLGWILDISERKQFERALAEAKQAAEEATKAKSEFLANMSHEIRTPMNAIIGMNSLLARTEMSSKQKDYCNKVGSSAQSLLGIINDILDFSKIEAGKLQIERVDFDLNSVLENLSNMINIKAIEKGLELVFDVDVDVPHMLVGDPLRLGQILLNLANNAVKFTHEGEIKVKVEVAEHLENEIVLKISINDTGIGMTNEQQGRLFQAFSQADMSTSRKYGGTGLGLTISKKLCTLMGGGIGAESVYGKGSTFYFTSKFGVQKNARKKSDIIPLTLKNMKVLVADDNVSARIVMENYLRDFDFMVDSVSSGEEAVRFVLKAAQTEAPYQLILMDWKMDGIDGIEASQRIRKGLDEKTIPRIIMVTGYGREDTMEQAMRTGLDSFLIKPVSQSLLFDTIIEVFDEGTENKLDVDIFAKKKSYKLEGIRGAKILLVEDNEINQQVAIELLEAEQFVVELAENGQSAVDLYQKTRDYDIILMDLQMPVMDGITAAQIILKDQKERQLNIPIIAMTADAMSGVEEEVVNIGMKGYITKPIDINELFTTLENWIAPGLRDVTNFTRTEVYNSKEILPEIEGVNVKEGLLRVAGNTKLYRKLLTSFTENYEHFKEDIIKALDDSDIVTAERLAHTLKGVSGNIGVNEVFDAVKVLDAELKKPSYEKAQVDIQLNHTALKLEKARMNIKEALRLSDLQREQSIKKELSKTETPIYNQLLAQELLEKLKGALASYSTDSEEIFEKFSKVAGAKLNKQDLAEIQKKIGDYDYESALESLEPMASEI